jgi:hypothetical protein
VEKNVKIICSPFNPSVEVVGDLTMKLHVPYSANEVTIQFNPNIQDYHKKQDKPGVQVRQVTLSTSTDQTKTAKFDFEGNNTHDIEVNDTVYNVRLMSIGKEKLQGQDFFAFEFFITTP